MTLDWACGSPIILQQRVRVVFLAYSDIFQDKYSFFALTRSAGGVSTMITYRKPKPWLRYLWDRVTNSGFGIAIGVYTRNNERAPVPVLM